MNLSLRQKIAITLSLFWLAFVAAHELTSPGMQTPGFFVIFLTMGFIPVLFILWISGALKPLIQWFKSAEQ